MKKSVKWLLILLAAAGVGYYFSENRDEEPEFATQKLSRGNITEKVTASGIINPISTINVGTQVSGTIKEIYVDYNSEVKKNQMLALIDPDLFEAKVAQQRARLTLPRRRFCYRKARLNTTKKSETHPQAEQSEIFCGQGTGSGGERLRHFDCAAGAEQGAGGAG